jgi:uncharacterized protein
MERLTQTASVSIGGTRGTWPTAAWADAARQRSGWEPVPFQEFILKVHGWCNLACDYCYMYEMADQSWRRRAMRMSPEVVDQTARRIGEHAAAHQVPLVHVVFHGGEPLLAGTKALARAAAAIRAAVPPSTEVRFRLQTNGTRLNARVLDVLLAHGIDVGVSLDGAPDAHDRHRRHPDGRGSYEATVRGLRLLTEDRYRPLFSRLLCTIDLRNDPVETYEALVAFGPPVVDFLLPHGNWTTPPPGRASDASTPYADWLIAVFERWYGAPRQETEIRTLQGIVDGVLGGTSRVDTVGLGRSASLVVDTDGTIQQSDHLKSTFDGAPETGFDVAGHPFDVALDLPAFVARQVGVDALCETCQRCEVRDVCGGGYYPHRYREGRGFLNPSVYCPDLLRLVGHIRQRIGDDLAKLISGSTSREVP